MRTITVNLYPNDGLGSALAPQGLSGRLVSLGSLSWAVDEQLTKLQPGSLSLKLWDEDEAVWTFLQTQLAQPLGGNQLLPPWLTLDADYTRRFLGLVDLSSLKRDFKTREVDLQAQDWTILLRDKRLDGWTRPWPKILSVRPGGGPWLGGSMLGGGLFGKLGSVVRFNFNLTATIQKGDYLQIEGGGAYKVMDAGFQGGVTLVVLEGFDWGGSGTANFYRVDATLGDQPFYSVAATVTASQEMPVYEIPLDTVDWLVPGDVLERAGKGQLKVDDIDSERKLVISATPITEGYKIADKLTLAPDSRLELVQQDALDLLRQALSPQFALDASAFAPPVLAEPVFAWLSWANKGAGEDLRGVHDAEPTRTALRVFGAEGKSWSGTPEVGYTVVTDGATRYVPWTSQLLAAPAILMPDAGPALAPRARDRNRAYFNWKFTQPRLVDSEWKPVDPDDTPITDDQPPVVVAHDYAAMRRWILRPSGWTEQRWSGSAWTAAVAVAPSSTSGGPWRPVAAVPFTEAAATTGPAPLGKALLVLAYSGSAYRLQLHFAGPSAAEYPITTADMSGGQLVTTPWGAYLVGRGGYGRVRYQGGALSLSWVQVLDASTCWLQPNTFAGLDADSVFALARLDWVDAQKSEKGSETRLFRLVANPVAGQNPILNGWDGAGVRIAPLPPRILTMFRDAADPTRLLGIFGSRLFQVAPRLPATIERVKAQGLSAGELVEHVCQAINAIADPRPDGSLRILPRTTAGAPTALAVDQTQIAQSRVSKHFFSVVRVGGEGDAYADARGAWAGGRVLEISGHPMIHGEAQAYAVASAYAAFHGRPRLEETQKWFWADADVTAPWEGLGPWSLLALNGGATTWILTGLSYDLAKGEAQATLLEA